MIGSIKIVIINEIRMPQVRSEYTAVVNILFPAVQSPSP